MNFLQEVTTFIGVVFISARKPFERRTERRGCLGIPLFLTGRAVGITHSFQVVAWRRRF